MVRPKKQLSCRTVESPEGAIVYWLERKSVKNMNLRVTADGTVRVSVPKWGTEAGADAFVYAKRQWILRSVERIQREPTVALGPKLDKEECVEILSRALAQVYPMVASYGVPMPELKVRNMKSQWGNCHWKQGYITLNRALARCPEELQRYVALHELVHFLEQNHGSGFYGYMDRFMPEWREYRSQLKDVCWVLREKL